MYANNAHIRYHALDRCFGKRSGCCIDDMIEACTKAMHYHTGEHKGVQKRQIYDDIIFMQSSVTYSIDLEKFRVGHKIYYRYTDINFSIKNLPLNPDEMESLKNTIFILKRFSGLPNFDWMDEVVARVENSFKLNSATQSVVSFEQNPYLKGLDYFAMIFDAIAKKRVLRINYHPAFKKASEYTIHPYHLKQYNNRWFLFGHDPNEESYKITNMAIDRIDNINIVDDTYIESDINFEEYFDDIVGVTIFNSPPVKIRLQVENSRYNYIESKPMHGSQKVKRVEADFVEIELNLIPNYEFENLLLSYMDNIKIIEPLSLIERMRERVEKINKNLHQSLAYLR